MKRKILASAFGFLILSFNANAVLLTGFGTSAATEPAFTIDGGSTSFSTSQTLNNLQITGSDLGNTVGGTFSVVDTTGFSILSLTGTLSGTNPLSSFNLQLFDGSAFQTYSGNWSSFGSGSPATVQLSLVSTDGGYDVTQVQGVIITANGSGSSIDFTLDNVDISAIPEPSTYLLLSMGLGLIYLTKRKRK